MSVALYHFAILRVVPHVHLGAFANVGVILHALIDEPVDGKKENGND